MGTRLLGPKGKDAKVEKQARDRYCGTGERVGRRISAKNQDSPVDAPKEREASRLPPHRRLI